MTAKIEKALQASAPIVAGRIHSKSLNETLLDFSLDFITNFIKLVDIENLSQNEMDCSSIISEIQDKQNEQFDLNSSLISSEKRVI